MNLLFLIVTVLSFSFCYGDVYLQYPRGSNNRLAEENRDRTNANRLFNSQNNARGGYNVGSTYYYVGSKMYIDWTAQHSCGNPNNNCEYILQYACDDLIRDGTTTTTIPDTPASTDANPEYGRHESLASYKSCTYRTRNRGLFTANRNLQGNSAIYTRQNEAGTKYGYECPEERDYYPYWHPTIWRDIAIFTNMPSRCKAYQQNSQNVQDRYYCEPSETFMKAFVQTTRTGVIPIDRDQCQNGSVNLNNINVAIGGTWTRVPAWGIPAPACIQNLWARDNHNGNVMNGYFLSYNWTVPDHVHERCVLRLRYNISTEDYPAWDSPTGTSSSTNATAGVSVQSAAPPNRVVTAPTANVHPAYVDIWSQFGLSYDDVAASFKSNNRDDASLKNSRDYVLKNDPRVNIFGSLVPNNSATQPQVIRLKVAMDTSQFGRTFQDRSHRFAIRAAPSSIQGAVVHNVGVRGKRGNIVQVYPATEYDFVPKDLYVKNGEFVHFQWTGSNTNNNDNAGNGLAKTDRSSIAVLRPAPFKKPTASVTASVPYYGTWGSSYPAHINSSSFLGLSVADRVRLATTSYSLGFPNAHMGGQMSQMDDGDTYFDLGPRQVTQNGVYYYTSTRNNDFSNRDHKAKIVVSDTSYESVIGGSNGFDIKSTSSRLTALAGAFTSAITVSIASSPPSTQSTFSGTPSSDYITISPLVLPLASGRTVSLSIDYSAAAPTGLEIVKVYRSDMINGSWSEMSSSQSDSQSSVDISKGGVYVVEAKIYWGAVIGIVVASVAAVGIAIGGGYLYLRKKRAGGGATSKSAKSPA